MRILSHIAIRVPWIPMSYDGYTYFYCKSVHYNWPIPVKRLTDISTAVKYHFTAESDTCKCWAATQ